MTVLWFLGEIFVLKYWNNFNTQSVKQGKKDGF
jgi:hypothetical protein